MQPEIVDKAGFDAVGIRIRTQPKSNEIAELWRDQGMRLNEVSNATGGGAVGVMALADAEQMIMDYMAAVPVNDITTPLPEGMSEWSVPAGTYAVFSSTLPTLANSFENFYQQWLPKSGYQRGAGPEYEEYGIEFDPNDPNSILHVCIPIEKT